MSLKKINVEVGQMYRKRNGSITRISGLLSEGSSFRQMGYVFTSTGSGQYYTADGKAYVDGDESDADLVELIPVEPRSIADRHVYEISGAMGVILGGKSQPLDSLVKTPNGWVRMGDIKLNQRISTPDGGAANVTGIELIKGQHNDRAFKK